MMCDDTVQLRLFVSKEGYEALERLQSLCGHATIDETIAAALRLYGVEQVGGVFMLAGGRLID